MKHRRFRVHKEFVQWPKAAIVDAAEIRHITRVLRLAPEDRVTLFDGGGNEYAARIDSVSPGKVSFVLLEEPARLSGESPLRIILGTALLKPGKFDWLLQKATELGVAEIVPFYSERVVPHQDETRTAGRLIRWEKIAAEAAKQCGRSRVPHIHPPDSLRSTLLKDFGQGAKIFLWEKEETGRLDGGLERGSSGVFALVGPEGGFSEAEADLARQSGFRPVGLGPRILRAETAGILIIGLLQFLLGDLR